MVSREPPDASSHGRLVLRRSIWPGSSKNEAAQAVPTPPLPSIPTTPAARARVKLPYTFLTSGQESPLNKGQSPLKDYFDGIKIPSPLLYHRRSREQLLTRSSDADIGTELTKHFLLTCGRDAPEPDFESYKVFDDTSKRIEPPQPSKPLGHSILPSVDDVLQKRQDFAIRNIPHPPWIVQLCQPDLHRLLTTPSVSLPEPHPATPPKLPPRPPILTTSNPFSISRLGIPCIESSTPYRDINSNIKASSSRFHCDLVYPKLPTPPPCVIADAQQQSSNRKASAEFIEDDLDEVSRRWQAFEDAISNPKCQISSSEDTVIARPAKSQPFPWTLQNAEHQPWFDFTACPTAKCMALVPARLYQPQYLEYLQSGSNNCNLKESSLPILESRVMEDTDADKVAKMADWINDLGLDTDHTEGCPVAAESGESSGLGLEQMFEVKSQMPLPQFPELNADTVEPSLLSSTESEVLMSEVSGQPSTDSESIDEGYFTGESTVNLRQEDAAVSEDGWPEWDWDDAAEDQGKTDRTQADQGLSFAGTEEVDFWAIGM